MASKYSDWTIKQLKEELNKRCCKNSGRKAELAARFVQLLSFSLKDGGWKVGRGCVGGEEYRAVQSKTL